MKRSILPCLLVASLVSPSNAADQQDDARSLEALFAQQSSVTLGNADWHQVITLSINDCAFTLKNTQHLPHGSAEKTYLDTHTFDLRLLDTRPEQAVKTPNPHTINITWHVVQAVFQKSFLLQNELTKQRYQAMGSLTDEQKRNPSERAKAITSTEQQTYQTALSGPDGELLKANNTVHEPLEPKDTSVPIHIAFMGFSLHVQPDAADSIVNQMDQHKKTWCAK